MLRNPIRSTQPPQEQNVSCHTTSIGSIVTLCACKARTAVKFARHALQCDNYAVQTASPTGTRQSPAPGDQAFQAARCSAGERRVRTRGRAAAAGAVLPDGHAGEQAPEVARRARPVSRNPDHGESRPAHGPLRDPCECQCVNSACCDQPSTSWSGSAVVWVQAEVCRGRRLQDSGAHVLCSGLPRGCTILGAYGYALSPCRLFDRLRRVSLSALPIASPLQRAAAGPGLVVCKGSALRHPGACCQVEVC